MNYIPFIISHINSLVCVVELCVVLRGPGFKSVPEMECPKFVCFSQSLQKMSGYD